MGFDKTLRMRVAPKRKSKTTRAEFAALAVIPREAGKAGRPKGPMRPLSTRRSIAVQRVMRDVRLAAPHLEVADSVMVKRFAELTILSNALFFEISLHGILDSKRQPRLVLDAYRRLVLAQTRIASELGLTPLARKQLSQAQQGDDLAAAMAKRVQRDEG